MAALRSWADCTRPTATGTLSRGQDTLASAMAITEKPANTPWRRRATRSCVMEVTRPMAAMVTMKPASERTIISLRPTRSARRPQSGPSSPASPGVTAMRRPDHTATSEGLLTPSSCTKRGRKGEKNWNPTKAVKTMRDSAHTLRCQLAGSAGEAIACPSRPWGARPRPPAARWEADPRALSAGRWSVSPEHDARRTPRLHDLAGGRELARSLIHAERDDRIAVLIRGVEERAGRLDGEEARRLALRRLPAHRCEHARCRVDGEDGEAVVSAIRSIDEAPGRAHRDLRGRTVAREGRRQ